MCEIKYMIESIDAFDARCKQDEHTDTGEAWSLLYAIRAGLVDLAKKKNPPVACSECKNPYPNWKDGLCQACYEVQTDDSIDNQGDDEQ